jgi:hypothetical protein
MYRVQALPDARGQWRGPFLKVGRALVTEARDRIGAAIEVFRGRRVLDQTGTELD